MAVAWVAGTALVAAEDSTYVDTNAPAGLANDDVLLAAIFARSEIVPPSGWTLVTTTGDFTDGTFTQRLSVYRKNTVTTADAGALFQWRQAGPYRIGVVYAAMRGVDEVAETDVDSGAATDYAFTPPSLTAASDGEMILAFVSVIYGEPEEEQYPDPPGSMTLFSGSGDFSYRLAGAYGSFDNGQSNAGAFDLHPTWTDPYSLSPYPNVAGAITIRLTAAAPVTPASDAWLQLPTMLGTGGELLFGNTPPAALMTTPGPLGPELTAAFMDFTASVDETQPKRYEVELITESGAVRAPISSWQATQQVGQSCYLQCVIPACDPFVDDIADATAFSIIRRGKLLDGGDIEYTMATSTITEATFSRSPSRNTCMLAGYFEAFARVEEPPSFLDRTLRDIRLITSSGSGTRVRCAVDWTLRPSQRAFYGEGSMVVSFINYYVNRDDEFMDVGSRNDAGA